MKLFAAIVLLTVPLVMAADSVSEEAVYASAKDEANALFEEIIALYTPQTNIAVDYFSDALKALNMEFEHARLERWDALRNATCDDVAAKAQTIMEDALDIGVDVRNEKCHSEFGDVVQGKRDENVSEVFTDCVYVAQQAEVFNLARIDNSVKMEMFLGIYSTASNLMKVCEAAGGPESCYATMVERLAMLRDRMLNVVSEIRILYATELTGLVGACDNSIVLSLGDWHTQTVKFITSCARNAVRNVISKRNLGMDV